MDYHALPRRQLQTLCKKHGIPANATNSEMADALSVLLKPKPDITKQPDKRATRRREPAVSSSESKVKDLESSDTQVQNALGSGEKSITKPQRATRSRDCATEAPTLTTKTENSKDGQFKITSAVKMQEAKTVSTRRRAGNQGEDELQPKPAEVASTKVQSPKSERKKDRAGGIVLRRGRVKVRSPLTSSKTPKSNKILGESDVKAESSEAGEGETMMPHTQSCLVDTQKISTRKNTRFVTFSEVLEVTHTFLEGPSAEVLMHAEERVAGSRTGSRRASRKDGIHEKTKPQAILQKSQKAPSQEVSKGKNVLSVSKQNKNNEAFSMSEAETSLSIDEEKTESIKSCSESSSQRSRKAGNEAIKSLNEKEKVSDSCNSVSNTRRSRRLTLGTSDIKLLQDKENASAVKGEENIVDSLEECNTDTLSVSSTRRSRRLTIIPSDVNIDQDKDKLTANSQVKSKGNHEGTTVSAPKETEGAPHAEISRRGRRRTLAPLEINHIQVTVENPGEELLKNVSKGNDTKSGEHGLGLETYIHNQSQKHYEARISESISVATQDEGNSITAEEVCSSENVRRGRQKNLIGIVGLSSKNNSRMERVPEKVARAVRKPDTQKTSKKIWSIGAGPAKSKFSCNEAEVQEEALKGEDVEITAAPEDTQDAAEISSLSNGPKETITQHLNDLEKAAAAKSSNDYEDVIVSIKTCIEGSIESLVQVIATEEGVNPVNSLSTDNINSNKCSGNKLEQNSAEGASIASCDAVLDSNLHALDMGSVSMAVANNTSCGTNVENSTLPVVKESSVEVASAAKCLETKKEDPLLASTFSCTQQEIVVCTQEDCAASNNSPMPDTKGSISPVATRMGPDENVDEGKQTPSRSRLVVKRMNSDEGYEEGNKHKGESLGSFSAVSTRMTSDVGIFDINKAVASTPSASIMVRSTEGNLGGTVNIKERAIEISSNKESSSTASRHMSSDEVTEQDNQHANDIDVEEGLGIEADAVVTEGLQAGGMNSPFDAVDTNASMQEVCSDASPLITNVTIDEGIINTKVTLGSPVLTDTRPAKGNLGGSKFTSLRSEIDEAVEQCCKYTGNMDVKNGFGVDADAVIKEGALVGETCTAQEMCSNIELLASHENEVVGPLLTEDVEHNTGHDQGSDFNLCKEEGAREQQEINCQGTSGERAPSGDADFEPEVIQAVDFNLPEEVKAKVDEEVNGFIADSLQGISRGDVVGNTTTDGQEGSLLPLCADVSGNTLPIPVAFRTKQRRTRAIYKSARKAKPSVLQKSMRATEIDFGPLMPWDYKEDVRVEDCSTLDMGSDEVDSSSPEESEEGGSQQMEDSFSDGDSCHLTTDVLPPIAYEDVSSYGSSEDSAYDSEEECSQEEEDLSVEEYCESEEVDTSEEDASESEDETEVGTGSFEASRALLSLAKRESSEASSTDCTQVTQVEPNATFEIALLDIGSMQPGIQHSSAHESAVSDEEVTVLASLSSLFATPPSKVNELVHCLSEPFCTDDALSNEDVSAENGQESMDRGEYHAEICKLVPSLGMEQEENVEVLEDVQRRLEGLSVTDLAVNEEEALTLESTFKNDYANKEFRAEAAAAKIPDQDICEEAYSKAPNEDVDAGKNHPNTSTKSDQNKKVLSESNAQSFSSQITKCSTPRSPKKLEVVQYLFAHKSLTDEAEIAPPLEIPPLTPSAAYVQGEQMIAQEDELRACPSDFMDEEEAVQCPELPQTPSVDLIHERVDQLALNATQVHSNWLMDEAEAPQCTDAKAEVVSEQMDELLENVLNETQVCENHLSKVTKEPPAALSSTMEIAKEQSLQRIDMTLMSLRKLKQMCKENDTTKKPLTETPSTRPPNARMSASKPNTSVLPRDLPSANKRSALKALPSNIKSNTPARTPTIKGMQTPRNLMRTYNSNEGENLAPSPRAPASSQRDFGRSVHH